MIGRQCLPVAFLSSKLVSQRILISLANCYMYTFSIFLVLSKIPLIIFTLQPLLSEADEDDLADLEMSKPPESEFSAAIPHGEIRGFHEAR
jgi:hypothetical protein